PDYSMLRLPWSVGSEWVTPLASSLSQIQATNATQKRGRRRTTVAPIGTPPVWEKTKGARIDQENRDLLSRVYEAERKMGESRVEEGKAAIEAKKMPLVDNHRRVGLLVKKIGMMPQWTKDGTRMLCTLLEVPSNNVISVTSPDEWYRKSMVGKRKAFNRDGPMWKVTVGAGEGEAWRFTSSYRAQFARAGTSVKPKLGSFLVSEETLPQVGIPLDARHFSVGQFVTATGKSIDWGFQGGMHRWGMRGQPQRRTTKSHRRIGSVGSVSDARIWPGKRMPGHMGWEWSTLSGIQIVRMNMDKQVIYVKGNVPGDVGEWLLLKDCLQQGKRPKEVAVPTWTPSLETIEEEKEEGDEKKKEIQTDKQQYLDNLFRFTDPSIQFTNDDLKKQAGRDKTKAKIAKVKK
ncbi:hypothetical protein PFISCL1PPCAC_10020, partial [Pristionchus fissidentatus]